MVYSSKDFESLWFLYQAEGLPKNISIEEFLSPVGSKRQSRALQKARSSLQAKRPQVERTFRLSTNGTGRRIRRASMEKYQLISLIHFLVKREDERAQENQELKDMV